MKITTGLLFISSAVSTLLFAVGFTQAAQKLDPVSLKSQTISTMETGEIADMPCMSCTGGDGGDGDEKRSAELYS